MKYRVCVRIVSQEVAVIEAPSAKEAEEKAYNDESIDWKSNDVDMEITSITEDK